MHTYMIYNLHIWYITYIIDRCHICIITIYSYNIQWSIFTVDTEGRILSIPHPSHNLPFPFLIFQNKTKQKHNLFLFRSHILDIFYRNILTKLKHRLNTNITHTVLKIPNFYFLEMVTHYYARPTHYPGHKMWLRIGWQNLIFLFEM